MKHRLKAKFGDKFDSSKTAFDNMEANGFDWIYDSGNLKFVWERE
jgi:hypothetical protein